MRIPFPYDPLWGDVLIARSSAPPDLSPRLARVIVELVVRQALVAQRLPDQQALKNKFIHDLLHGPTADEQTLLREAHLLGFDLVPPRAVLLIDAAAFIPDMADAADPSLARGETLERQVRLLIGLIVNFGSSAISLREAIPRSGVGITVALSS